MSSPYATAINHHKTNKLINSKKDIKASSFIGLHNDLSVKKVTMSSKEGPVSKGQPNYRTKSQRNSKIDISPK